IKHIKYSTNPILRKYTLIILGMIPVYATISFLGLVDKYYTTALDSLRECYESLVIYAFFEFLLAYLSKGQNHLLYIKEIAQKYPDNGTTNHLFPFKYCLKRWSVGKQFLFNNMIGVFQYVVIKLFCGVVIFILTFLGVYTPGHLSWSNGYPYIVLITNFSQIWAMYCLVMFYHQFKDDLKDIHPIAKLICIKSVVFFTFWQGIVISIFVKLEVITPTNSYTTEQIASSLQNFIICIEMLLAAILHKYAFPCIEFFDPRHISTVYKSYSDYFMEFIWPYAVLDNKDDDLENNNSEVRFDSSINSGGHDETTNVNTEGEMKGNTDSMTSVDGTLLDLTHVKSDE
ncbi:MAG: transmembrane protein 184C-like protein, partial [Edafosvirus sp.]